MIFAPIHITGFFQPVIKKDLHLTGSLGAGFSLTEYVQTETRRREDKKIRVFFNGENITSQACTSKQAAKEFFRLYGERRGVEIYHTLNVPISSGLATSGAGALGVVFSLNETFNASFSDLKLSTLAHVAEVKQKTGLGSVIAQWRGGFEIRTKAGSPQKGTVRRIRRDEKCAIIIFGQIQTKDILSSIQKMRKIRQAFGTKHKKLVKNFSIERFIKFSYHFAEKSGLLTSFLQELLRKARNLDLIGSMLMLGKGVFLFGQDLNEKIKKLLHQIENDPKRTILRKIDNKGVFSSKAFDACRRGKESRS